ncbi:MAG: hypothetical protein IJ325_07970 [Clostridia bacterium]|nr:hypothetical protein [Clostridia bacterium]
MSDTKTQTKEPLYNRPLEQLQLNDLLQSLQENHPRILTVHTIGTSIQGEGIPAVVLGNPENSRGIVYVGGIDGSDWLSTSLLMRFISDYCRFLREERRLYSISLPYLHANRVIYVIPRLNPDGAAICRRGPGTRLAGGRLTRLCPDGDYSAWCANGCGAVLRDAFTEENAPDTPEVTALQQYLRMCTPSLCLTLDSDPMHCPSPMLNTVQKHIPRAKTVGRLLSRMASCPFSADDMPGTLSHWFTEEFNRPGLSFSLGADRSENGFYHSYASLREVLFSCPLLI